MTVMDSWGCGGNTRLKMLAAPKQRFDRPHKEIFTFARSPLGDKKSGMKRSLPSARIRPRSASSVRLASFPEKIRLFSSPGKGMNAFYGCIFT